MHIISNVSAVTVVVAVECEFISFMLEMQFIFEFELSVIFI